MTTLPEHSPYAEQPHGKPLGSRAKLVVACLGVTIAGAALSLWADLLQADVLQQIVDGDRVSLTDANAADDRVAWTGAIYGIGTVLSAIAFLLWYHRAYTNALTRGAEPRFGTGWAVGYWFIPIVNLFRPKQVVNHVWRNNERDGDRVSPLLNFWWGFWLLSTWVGNFALRTTFNAREGTQALVDESYAYAVSEAFDIVAAVLAILVVRRMTEGDADAAQRSRTASESANRPSASAYQPPSASPDAA